MKERTYYLDGEEKFGAFSSRFYSFFSGLSNWKYYRAIVSSIGKYNPASVLDVGCGPGDLLIKLGKSKRSTLLYGIDPSASMVRIAQRKINKNNLGRQITVKNGSSRNVPFDLKFDLIISTFSFHHWSKQAESVEYLSHYLSPGGRILIFDLDSESCPGRLPMLKKHSISTRDSEKFSISLLDLKFDKMDDVGLIKLTFTKQPANNAAAASS